MKVDIITDDYERSHGRTPRGRGSWAFCVVDPRRNDYLDHVIWTQGTYQNARRDAVAVVRQRNAQLVAGQEPIDALFVCS